MPTLREQLNALSARFAEQIVAAIKAASLHELHAGDAGARVGNGKRIRSNNQLALFVPPAPAARVKPSGRLARRSDDEIAVVLNKIVLL
ncbi:MAG TPA: hypothetical protein VHV30_03550, partial [Polyangiaceae bacterium]|nr:hypothetical protein [Polyangiaceae bacterium]